MKNNYRKRERSKKGRREILILIVIFTGSYLERRGELRLEEDNCFKKAKNYETPWNKVTQEINAQKVNVTKSQIINKRKTMAKKYKEVIDQNGLFTVCLNLNLHLKS